MEPASCWEQSSIVHSDLTGKEHNAEEVPQLCIEPEGRDNTDSQDAEVTIEEIRVCPDMQTVPYVSSNDAPACCENTIEVI
jgi:hypothetical protein